MNLTSLPDSNYADHHTQPNGMETLFCPDCGTACELTGTSEFGNARCFTCRDPEFAHSRDHHWLRYSGHVDYIRKSECEIPHPKGA